MELHFNTKEESKAIAQSEFLRMDAMERFWTFVRLNFFHNSFYGRKEKDNASFVVHKKSN